LHLAGKGKKAHCSTGEKVKVKEESFFYEIGLLMIFPRIPRQFNKH
jgi:hypothetical protein